MKITIKAEPINTETFEPFGAVVDFSKPAQSAIDINDGFAQKYPNILVFDNNEAGSRTTAHIYVAKNRHFPLAINMLECHPFFSQTFVALESQSFIVVVAPPADSPDPSQIKAFVTNGKQGVHFSRGVWHFPLIALNDGSSFLVLDRLDLGKGDVDQCVVSPIDSEIFLEYTSC